MFRIWKREVVNAKASLGNRLDKPQLVVSCSYQTEKCKDEVWKWDTWDKNKQAKVSLHPL